MGPARSRTGRPARWADAHLAGLPVRDLAGPIAVRLGHRGIPAALHHADHFPDDSLRLAPVADVEVNLERQLAVTVLGELGTDLARRLETERSLEQDALPQTLDLAVAELVVKVPPAVPDTMHDHRRHKAGVVAEQ